METSLEMALEPRHHVGSPIEPQDHELAEIIRNNLIRGICMASPRNLEIDGDNYDAEMNQFVNLQISDEDLDDILRAEGEVVAGKHFNSKEKDASPGSGQDEGYQQRSEKTVGENDPAEDFLEDITSVINEDKSYARHCNTDADVRISSPGPATVPRDRGGSSGARLEAVDTNRKALSRDTSVEDRSRNAKGTCRSSSKLSNKRHDTACTTDHNFNTICAPDAVLAPSRENTKVKTVSLANVGSDGGENSNSSMPSTDEPGGGERSPINIASDFQTSSLEDGGELCVLKFEDYSTCSFDEFQLLSNEDSELVEHGRRGRPPRSKIEKSSTLAAIQPRMQPQPVFSAPGSFTAPRGVAPNIQGNTAVYPHNVGVQPHNGGVVTCRFPVILKPDPANATSVHIQICPGSQGSFNSPSSQSNDGYLTSPPPTDGSECSTVKHGRASVKSDTSQSFSESNMSVCQEGDLVPEAQRQVSIDGPPSRLQSLHYPYDEFSFISGFNPESHNRYMEPQSSQGHYQRTQNVHHTGLQNQHPGFPSQHHMNQDCAQGPFIGVQLGQGQHIVVAQGQNVGAPTGHGQHIRDNDTFVTTQSHYNGAQDQQLVPNGSINMPPSYNPLNRATNNQPPVTSFPQNMQAYLKVPTQKMEHNNGSLAHYQQQVGHELMGRYVIDDRDAVPISASPGNPPVIGNGLHVSSFQPSNVYQSINIHQFVNAARPNPSGHPCVGRNTNGAICCPHPDDGRSVQQLMDHVRPAIQLSHQKASAQSMVSGAVINNWYAHGSATQNPGAPSVNLINSPIASQSNQGQFPNSAMSEFPGQSHHNVSSRSRSNATSTTMSPKPVINLPKERKHSMVDKWIQSSTFVPLDSGVYDPSDHSLKCGATNPAADGTDSDPHIIYGLDGKPYELQYPTPEKPKSTRKSKSSRPKIPSTSRTSVSGNLSASSYSSAKGEKSCAKPESVSGSSVGIESSQSHFEALNNQIQAISNKPMPRDKNPSVDHEEEEKKRADHEIEKFLNEKRQQSLENKKSGVLLLDSRPNVSSLEQILNKSNVDMLSLSSGDMNSIPYINMSLEGVACENPDPQSMPEEKLNKPSLFDYSTYITPQDIKSLEEQKAQNGKTSLDNYLNGVNVQEKNNIQGNGFSQVNGGPLVQLRQDNSDTCLPVMNTTQATIVPGDLAVRAPAAVSKNLIKAVKRRSQENEELHLRQELEQALHVEARSMAGSLLSDYGFTGACQGQQTSVKPCLYNPTCVVPNQDQAQSRQQGSTFQKHEAGHNALARIPKLHKDHQLCDWVLKHQPQFKVLSNLYQDETDHNQHSQQFVPSQKPFAFLNKQQPQPAGQLKIPLSGKLGQPMSYPEAPLQMLNKDDFKVPQSVSQMPVHSSTFPSIGGGSDISMHSDMSISSLTRQHGSAFEQPAINNGDPHQQVFRPRGIPQPHHFQQQSNAHNTRNQQSSFFFQQSPESYTKDPDCNAASVDPSDHHMVSRLQNEMPPQGLTFNLLDFQCGQRINKKGLNPAQGHQHPCPELMQSSPNGSYLHQCSFPVSQMANQQPSQPASQSHFMNIPSPHYSNFHATNSTMGTIQSSPVTRNSLSVQGHQGHQATNSTFTANSKIGDAMGTHLYTNNMTPSCPGILGSNSQNGFQTKPPRPPDDAVTYSQTLESILPNKISYVQSFPMSLASTPTIPSMANIPQSSYQDRLDSNEDMLQDLLAGGFPSLDEPPCNYDDIFLNSRGPTDNIATGSPEGTPKPGEPEGKKVTDQTSIEKVMDSNGSSMEVSKKAGDSDVSVMTISYGSSDVELPSFEPDNDGETCLHLLCEMPAEHRERLATQPRFKDALNLLSRNGETALFIAVRNYKVDVVKFLLLHRADVNINCFSQEKSFRSERVQHTALHEAVEIGNKAVVEALLGAKDIQVDAKGSNGGLTPLMQAMHIHKMSKRKDIIMMLIKNNASLLQQDTIQGKTALMYAIQSHDVTLVEDILLMVGAEKARLLVTAVDRKGNTCLHLAAGLQQPIKTEEKQRLLRCIILAGGDPSVKNNEGESARDWDRKNIAEVLQKLGRAAR